jgi:hypothetical protein
MSNTEKQTVHDWSTGELVTYEIEVEVVEKLDPPSEPNQDNAGDE